MGEALQAVGVYVAALTQFTAWWCRAVISYHFKTDDAKKSSQRTISLGGSAPIAVGFWRDWLGGDYGFALVMGLLLTVYIALRRIER